MPLTKGNYFPGQKRTERVVRFIRRHTVSYVPWVSSVVILCILPWILILIFNAVGFPIVETLYSYSNITFGEKITNNITIIIFSIYYQFLIAYSLKMWIDYYLDVIFITPEHLVNIQQIGLLNHKVAEQSLLRVQDVTARISGFWQTFFRYGTVVVETAGDEPNFLMKDIPKPNDIANIVLKLHEEMVEHGGLEDELMEGIGGERSKPAAEKRRGLINKVVYNLPPNRNPSIYRGNNYTNTNLQQFENKMPIRTIELEDSKVVVIQEPKQSHEKNAKTISFKKKKKTVEKIRSSIDNIKSESSLLNLNDYVYDDVKLSFSEDSKINKKPRKQSNKIEEGILKDGEEIKL